MTTTVSVQPSSQRRAAAPATSGRSPGHKAFNASDAAGIPIVSREDVRRVQGYLSLKRMAYCDAVLKHRPQATTASPVRVSRIVVFTPRPSNDVMNSISSELQSGLVQPCFVTRNTSLNRQRSDDDYVVVKTPATRALRLAVGAQQAITAQHQLCATLHKIPSRTTRKKSGGSGTTESGSKPEVIGDSSDEGDATTDASVMVVAAGQTPLTGPAPPLCHLCEFVKRDIASVTARLPAAAGGRRKLSGATSGDALGSPAGGRKAPATAGRRTRGASTVTRTEGSGLTSDLFQELLDLRRLESKLATLRHNIVECLLAALADVFSPEWASLRDIFYSSPESRLMSVRLPLLESRVTIEALLRGIRHLPCGHVEGSEFQIHPCQAELWAATVGSKTTQQPLVPRPPPPVAAEVKSSTPQPASSSPVNVGPTPPPSPHRSTATKTDLTSALQAAQWNVVLRPVLRKGRLPLHRVAVAPMLAAKSSRMDRAFLAWSWLGGCLLGGNVGTDSALSAAEMFAIRDFVGEYVGAGMAAKVEAATRTWMAPGTTTTIATVMTDLHLVLQQHT